MITAEVSIKFQVKQTGEAFELAVDTCWLSLLTQRSQTQHAQPPTLIFHVSFRVRQLDSIVSIPAVGEGTLHLFTKVSRVGPRLQEISSSEV